MSANKEVLPTHFLCYDVLQGTTLIKIVYTIMTQRAQKFEWEVLEDNRVFFFQRFLSTSRSMARWLLSNTTQ